MFKKSTGSKRRALQVRTDDELRSKVSHELRTPLTSLVGYLDLLADGDAGACTARQLLIVEGATRNAQRLAVTVENLLDLATIDPAMLIGYLARDRRGALASATR